MRKFAKGLVIAALAAFGAGAPAVYDGGAFAANDGPWQVRVRAIGIVPDENATVTVLGGGVDVSNEVVPELDITYFFTDHFAAELILATARHEAMKTNAALDLGSVRLLPPTLTLQYHPFPKAQIRPYVGAGVNYTFFYDVDAPTGLSIDYDNKPGLALQAGVDIPVGNGWLVNLDVKKLFLETDVTINGGAIRADLDIDPWIIGGGIGYRF